MKNVKTRAGLKLKKEENKLGRSKVKKKKSKTTKKKDEENILSKDIDVEQEMRDIERISESRGMKQRDISNVNYSKNYIKNLKFRPMKYKGNYLPYHLRWIFSNTVKSNEIALIQEVEALENEINRLKAMKNMNREFRKISGLPCKMIYKIRWSEFFAMSLLQKNRKKASRLYSRFLRTRLCKEES
jgi:hypothetical protein